MNPGFVPPDIFRIDDRIDAADVDDARFEPACHAGVRNARATGRIFDEELRRHRAPARGLVGRNVDADRFETEPADTLALSVIIARAGGDLQPRHDLVGRLGVDAVRIGIDRAALGIGAAVEQVKRQVEPGDRVEIDREIGGRHDHAAAQPLAKIHRPREQIEITRRVEDRPTAEQAAVESFLGNHRRTEIMERVVIVPLAQIVADDQQVEIGRGPEQQRQARGLRVAVVDRMSGEQIDAVTIALLDLARQPRHQHVARDRPADTALERLRVIVSIDGPRIAGQFGRGSVGDHVDRARGGAAAIGGALRPTQYLDLLEIVEACELRRRAADHRAVLEERDRAVRAQIDAGKADAADEGAVDAELVTHGEVGDGRGEIAHILDAARTELLG